MKTILVPTDFSKGAYNATKYAVELSKVTKAKIVLLHIYHIPIPPPEVSISPISISDLHDESMKRLKNMAEFELDLNKGETDFEIECEATTGPIIDIIIETAKKHKAGMIVMGTQGASGIINEYIVGSNTASVIEKATCPVLAIPEGAKYFGLKRFVFATNFEEIKNTSSLDSLLEIALLFNSEIFILSIRKNETELPSVSQALEGLNLANVFERVPHSFHSVVSENIAAAIDQFTIDHNADLLATLPQKHSYWELLFNKSITRKLVFHSQTPVLTLPANK